MKDIPQEVKASLPPGLSQQVQSEIVGLLADPTLRTAVCQTADKHLPQILDFGYNALQSAPNGSVDVSPVTSNLGKNPEFQKLQKDSGVDLSFLTDLQSVGKSDSKNGVALDFKSSKDEQISLANEFPGLDLNINKDAGFTVENPNGGSQMTIDNIKGVSISEGPIKVDPTKLTVGQSKDGRPELQFEGTTEGIPANVKGSITFNNGKPSFQLD